MTAPLLRVSGVGKAYPSRGPGSHRWRAVLQILRSGTTQGDKRVLSDIDFEVLPGESVGIIGANGAGKSTLLKLITGVLAPSEGEIERRGSIAALLELGAGFEPESTGLENLRMNAAFLGLSRSDVEERMDDILSFADIGEAIHEPIKTYSSGMVVRLGFAVVASVRPDLLITDEVLAVGDESFQKKCIRWIERYLADGGTLLMVSHNMYQVQKLCRHALWLEHGRARAWGDVFDVTQGYLAWHERRDAEARDKSGRKRADGARYRVDALELGPRRDDGPVHLAAGETLTVDLALRSPDDRAPQALVGIVRADGTPVFGVASDHDGVELERRADGRYTIGIDFDDLALLPGSYVVRAHAMDPEGLRLQDTLEREFSVSGRSRSLGLVTLPHRWRTAESPEP
ncbi:ABC transporter ATP-binding protein [Halomonas denitrificans]|nr:ABC transporter ATP-binding protein [Halomonas denitrificans]